MSKASKSRSKDLRKKKKAARKASQKALYESFKNAGKNTKSKRSVLRGKRIKKLKVISHPHGRCGNIGCSHCFGPPTYSACFVDGHLLPGSPHAAWLASQRQE